MTVLESLDAAALGDVMARFRDALRAHQAAINRLNVYPVPDGDTGTNMALTLESVVAEMDGAGDDLAAVCQAISHGSLMGARGNSGVILSQVMRGFTGVVRDAGTVDGQVVAQALVAAAESAYGAVMRPVEGTILTVVREASEAAAAAAGRGASLVEVLDAARQEGGESLSRTPQLLPVLAEAGVVDAGGSGFLLLLDAMLHVVDGRPVPEPTEDEGIVSDHPHLVTEHGHHDHDDVGDLRYEVMYFLEAPDESIPAFKDVWAGIGDSIVVVGGDGIWNCHIHTDDIGAAIEAAIDCGKPRNIRVTDLLEQVEEERWVRDAAAVPGEPAAAPEVPCAVVAVATGGGVRRLLGSLGVHHVVAGGQSMNPSTAQLLEAVEAAPAGEVVILPNNKNIVAVANQVDAQTTKTVTVVPTHSVAQGLATLLAYDPHSTAAANASSMAEVASGVTIGEVTTAVRDSTCDAGPITAGDFIGIAADGILAVSTELASAAIGLLERIVHDEHEIVGILEGEGATAAVTRRITEWLREHRPEIEVEIHNGGQPLYPYQFGVE
ncbi:DAK2 domain-containing protein [Actinomarinicola tropica]|uniref:DAK2 domain-containing protein n=1 Tax=Actinomarinicola tropica TaxID=2789776 RepID=A0A5Q2RGJ2_9ACTN|nr:DAK2 domain-containing protein [Actinomarinicola tropica]QGG94833.1 DAK2 domain-containing protein [Actinomarinicola tropica]